MTRSAAWIFIASLLSGCAAGGETGYRPVRLSEVRDPLAPESSVVPWRPPRQMAVYVHPHEDRSQGIMIGGHWILVLLGEGSWYFEESVEREPVPDAEATPEEKRSALRALAEPGDIVVPYRAKEKEGDRP